MIGIYKITSPSNKVYIGQSINIEKRFSNYKRLSCKNQTALYNSFLKHSVENHTFEVIEECSIELLNERERYFQDLYDVLSKGLNCKLTTTNSKSGKMSIESNLKNSNSSKNYKPTELTKNKISEKLKGKLVSNTTKLKLSKQKLGNKNPMFGKEKQLHHNYGKKWICNKRKETRSIIDLNTNIIYLSIYEASEKLNIPTSTLYKYILGYNKKIINYKYHEANI